MHILDSFFLVALRAIFWLQCTVRGCKKLVHISAICQTFCQNSPNPFPPPPTALNRRERTEAELQSYKKRGCRLLWRTVIDLYFFKSDTSAFHVFRPLFVPFFTVATKMEKQTDSHQKSGKLRLMGQVQLNCSGCWSTLLWYWAQSSNQHIKTQNDTRGFFKTVCSTPLAERGSWG